MLEVLSMDLRYNSHPSAISSSILSFSNNMEKPPSTPVPNPAPIHDKYASSAEWINFEILLICPEVVAFMSNEGYPKAILASKGEFSILSIRLLNRSFLWEGVSKGFCPKIILSQLILGFSNGELPAVIIYFSWSKNSG